MKSLDRQQFMLLNELILEAGSYLKLFDACEGLLKLLRTVIPIDYGLFFFHDDTDMRFKEPFLFNISQQTHNSYMEYYCAIDDIRNIDFNKPRAARSTDIIDYKYWRNTEYFNDFMRANDFYYQLKADIHYNNKLLSSLSLLRNRERGDFEEKHVISLEILRPHLGNHMYKLMVMERQEKLIRQSCETIDSIIACSQEGYCLSERESDIANLAIRGLTNDEISDLLFISADTVKRHLKNIFIKTGVKNRTELLAKLIGLIDELYR